jgi:hypothetical protein
LSPGVPDVGLISPGGVVGVGDGFDWIWSGVIVNGWFIPFSSVQKFMVVVVGGNAVVVVMAAVVSGVVPVVVVVITTHAMIPTVT